jgi:hypothetical protein
MKTTHGTINSTSAVRAAAVGKELSDATAVVELSAEDLDKVAGGLLIKRPAPVEDLIYRR